MISVKAILGKEHYRTQLESETNRVIADELPANGGKGSGFTPHELLASSLASCMAMTLRMYADRKQWDLSEVHVTVHVVNDALSKNTRMECAIELLGDLSAEQRNRLMVIAGHCPVHKILTNPIQIQTKEL